MVSDFAYYYRGTVRHFEDTYAKNQVTNGKQIDTFQARCLEAAKKAEESGFTGLSQALIRMASE